MSVFLMTQENNIKEFNLMFSTKNYKVDTLE
jgi:hypothetical protein